MKMSIKNKIKREGGKFKQTKVGANKQRAHLQSVIICKIQVKNNIK